MAVNKPKKLPTPSKPMTKKEVRRQQRVNRRELLKVITKPDQDLHTLLTGCSLEPIWTEPTPQKYRAEWQEMLADMRRAASIGWLQGVTGDGRTIKCTAPRAWRDLIHAAHEAGLQAGLARVEAARRTGIIPAA